MQSMISYHNDWTVFFLHPLSGSLMAVSIVAICYPIFRQYRQKQKGAARLGLRSRSDERGVPGLRLGAFVRAVGE